MCTIQEQFNGFLTTQQLKLGADVGVNDMQWNPALGLEINSGIFREMNTQMLVGRKAERFLSAYFEAIDGCKTVAENVQIVENNVTLGELDAILLHKDKLVHLEVVYKFYLYDPTIEGAEMEQWIGPNRKDILHAKVEKLRTKQFPFLTHPATKRYIIQIGLNPDAIEQELLFLANCFVPWKFQGKLCFQPDGFWLTNEQFLEEELKNRLFFIPSKHEWMIRECQGIAWKPRDDIAKELENQHSVKRSPIVWIKGEDEQFQRVFVVWW